jgi:phosphoribosyl-dephospho-CoA transferase
MDSVSATSPFVHDLLLLKSAEVSAACTAKPPWVSLALNHSPWVVVRRTPAPDGKVAIGVRGHSRQQRWGGFSDLLAIVKVMRPNQLRSALAQPNRRSLPVFQLLESVERKLAGFNLDWGPCGSVGFELATSQQVTHPESDLDLVIYAPERIEDDFAQQIWNTMAIASGKLDIRVETPHCGFSLCEYARGQSSTILLRTPAGPRLGEDPWAQPKENGSWE